MRDRTMQEVLERVRADCERYWGCVVAGVGMAMWERSKTIRETGLELELVPGIARLQGQSMPPEAAA